MAVIIFFQALLNIYQWALAMKMMKIQEEQSREILLLKSGKND